MKQIKSLSVRRGLALTLALSLLLTSCGGGGASAATMHLRRAEGTVGVSDSEGKAIEPREDLGLYSGYGVDTGSESYAWIDLDEVKLTKLDQDSEIAITKEGKKLEIEVKTGSLFFNVTEPLDDDETLNIRSSTMLVGIRGTCGWVTQDTAALLEGTVEVTAGDQSVTVTAGEMATVAGDGQITVKEFSMPDIPAFVEAELDGLEKIDNTLSLLEERQEADRARKAALLEALDGLDEEEAMYAALGDLNGDGVEDLLVLGRHQFTYRLDFCFSGYLWDGAQVQYVPFQQTEFLDPFGSESYQVYRERDTGMLYGAYFFYMDASYNHSFENAAGVIPMGIQLESEMFRPTEEQLQALQAQIDQRFELAESLEFPVREVTETGYELTQQYDWYNYWQGGGARPAQLPSFHASVDAVRAQLAE